MHILKGEDFSSPFLFYIFYFLNWDEIKRFFYKKNDFGMKLKGLFLAY